MQSWIINDTKKITLNTIENTEFNQKTHAKVKVARASLCSSDIAGFMGKYSNLPIVPSRTALGVISESKDISLSKGQRVFLSPYTKDENKLLVNGKDINGYLSDYVVAPLHNIYDVPESLSDEAFTFIEDIAMDLKVCELLNIRETEYVLLYGATSLNLILAQFCLYYQAIPIVVDNDQKALDKAEELGVYYTIDTSIDNLSEKLKEITTGKLAEHLVVDADCFPELDPDILQNVAINGKVAFLGYNTATEKIKIDVSHIVGKRLSIYGFNDGIGELETAINMLATGIIKVDSLVEKVYDFSEVQTAFIDLSSKRNRFKSLVRC